MGDIASKLLPVFLEETGQRLALVNLALAGEDCGIQGIKEAYRAAHTIKGTAALVKLPTVRDISGQMEELLTALLRQRRTAPPRVLEALRGALGHLQRQVEQVAFGGTEDPRAAEEVRALFAPFRRTAHPATAPVPDPSPPPREDPVIDPPLAAEPASPVSSGIEAPPAAGMEELVKSLTPHLEGEAEPAAKSVINICCQFEVSGKRYSLPMAEMVEIGSLSRVFPLPLAPAYVRGLLNLRGQVMPVVDLDPIQGVPVRTLANRHLVIAEQGGDRLAFLTDGIPALAPEFAGETINLRDFLPRYGIRAN
jgi:chemotaxis protein histidine kinase CheA